MVKYYLYHSDVRCTDHAVVSTVQRLCGDYSITLVTLDQIAASLPNVVEAANPVKVREPTMIRQSSLLMTETEGVPLLSLTAEWSLQSVPFLPEFKKQIVASQKSPDLLLFDHSAQCTRAKMLILVDICTSLHKSISSSDLSLEGEDEDDTINQNTEVWNNICIETIEITVRPNWKLYESTLSGDKMVKFEVIQQQVARYIHKVICELEWSDHISDESIDFIIRVVCAILRERRIPRDIKSIPDTIKKVMAAASSEASGVDVASDLSLFGAIAESERLVKPLPSPEEGLSVFEYFSGIGGMRLGLPESVRGIPVRHVVAYDVSNVANEVYHHNFERNNHADSTTHKLDSKSGVLKRVSIDGLKLHEVDGKADIWTMSPPCQPYTTTKGAHRQDQLDNRSRGIFHLMELLLQMRQLPRWIVLENVKGFLDSNVLQLWKQVIRKCGYRYQQYLLSPDTAVGLPNCRTRYYFIAEHSTSSGESRFLSQFSGPNLTTSSSSGGGGLSRATGEDKEDASEPKRAKLNSEVNEGVIRGADGEKVHTLLPSHLASAFPSKPLSVGEVLAQRPTTESVSGMCHHSNESVESLLLTDRVLSATWSMLLSVVGPYDRQSYCFTKGYGKIFDRSTGSCYYPEAEGPLADAKYQLDKSDLLPLKGKLRLFDPSEILLLSGFPVDFSWPLDMPIQQRFACIGNSVNVTVVKAVMKCLFD